MLARLSLLVLVGCGSARAQITPDEARQSLDVCLAAYEGAHEIDLARCYTEAGALLRTPVVGTIAEVRERMTACLAGPRTLGVTLDCYDRAIGGLRRIADAREIQLGRTLTFVDRVALRRRRLAWISESRHEAAYVPAPRPGDPWSPIGRVGLDPVAEVRNERLALELWISRLSHRERR